MSAQVEKSYNKQKATYCTSDKWVATLSKWVQKRPVSTQNRRSQYRKKRQMYRGVLLTAKKSDRDWFGPMEGVKSRKSIYVWGSQLMFPFTMC